MRSAYLKRFFDLTVSATSLIVLSPAILGTHLAVSLNLGSPTIFRQNRPGLRGKIFEMYKFRSMTTETDENGELLPDADRLPRFGKLLRSTSLDELPNLVNVLKGEMSLVGPRPLLVEWLPLYNDEQARRHDVLPGITGWAVVNGRNSLTWEEKFEFDVWYVENQSFFLDLKILYLTVARVFGRKGVSQKGEATFVPFTGTKVPKSADD